jgi:E3 ubiquitin-protein ligase RBBP6
MSAIAGKKHWDPHADRPAPTPRVNAEEAVHVDLSRMNGSEEDKINAMMRQSTMDYDPTK